ncbi:MAG: tetratricopeptide repeat protein, partial [Rhodospirillales bacterium]
EAQFRRANLLRGLNRLADALAGFERAVALDPGHAAAWNNRGVVLKALGRLDQAVESYDRALAAKPDFAEAAANRGLAFRSRGSGADALASYDEALAHRPSYADAWIGRGIALHDLNRLDDALASFDKAINIDSGQAEAWSSRGNVLADLGRIGEALASFERALAADPEYAPAHWNESLCRLLAGDFDKGWQKYEWRWRVPSMMHQKRSFACPAWTGAGDLMGKTVLLHAEQGLGDTIQFCRYAALVAGRGAQVVLEVQPALKSVLDRLAGPHQVIARGERLPPFDFHCPLLSLPLAFATTLETVPNAVPYVTADPALVGKWSARLARVGRHRIGLVWSGNRNQKNDRNRSLALSRLAPLFELDASFVSLQKELRPEDAEAAAGFGILHFGGDLGDFSDTAALVSLMDAVVAVDTSVAHLAGAMGKRLLVILPRIGSDWRWLLDRDDSPWYPTAVLLRRENRGDLERALPAVKRLLAQSGRP